MNAPVLHAFSRMSRTVALLTATMVAVLALAAPRVYAQAQARIGVVNVQRVVAETAEGRAIADALKVRFDERQRDLDRRAKVIQQIKQRVEHPTTPIPQARLREIAQQYQEEAMGLQQAGAQYSEEIQQLQSQMLGAVAAKIQPIVRQIGQTENYQIILDEAAVQFSPAHLNLTDRVIQLYNQQFPVRGPVQLPDLGLPAPPGGGASTAPPAASPRGTGTGSVGATPAGDAGVPGNGRPLPGVFFRRDGGR